MKKQLLILMALLPAVLWANDSINGIEADTLSVSHLLELAVADTSLTETDSLQKPYILNDMPLVRVLQDTLIEVLLK